MTINPPPLQIIVAMTRDRVIGDHNRLPWHLPEDLQLFRRLTTGQTVLMGRNTYASIGRALPERNNIVISARLAQCADATLCRSLEAGLEHARTLGTGIFCIGGADLYRQCLPLADTLHISWVGHDSPGTIRFPDFALEQWLEVERQPYSGFTYCRYRRRNETAP